MAFRSRSSAPRTLLVLCGALALVQACGGRSDTEPYLFGADDPITVGGSSGAGGSGTAGRGGSPGVAASAGVGVGASSPTGGAVGAAGEPSVGGAGVAGSGQGGGATAGTTSVAGAAGAPDGPFISCGASACDTDTQACCASLGGLQCVAKGTSCQGAVLGCTTNGDCGVDLCCFSITGDASAASSCKPQCSFMGGGRDRQLCESDDDCRPPFRFCTPTVFGVSICTRRP